MNKKCQTGNSSRKVVGKSPCGWSSRDIMPPWMVSRRRLNDNGTTIVMVTHSQRDASYAHRIVNMLDGFLVENTAL